MSLNEAQEGIGAAAYRLVNHQPHIPYGTQFDRFGWTVPPNPLHLDCSGAASHAYWEGARIKIGGDTGAIAQDVAHGRAQFVSTSALRPIDLVMRRSGNVYNGGPDEHVGIYIYSLPDGRPVTFESAGSKNGAGYYPRPRGFWRDGVRYPQVASAPDFPKDEDNMTDSEKQLLFAMLAEIKDMSGWLLAGELEGGYDVRTIDHLRTPKILAEVRKP